jgi:hypothetical protein
VSPSDQPANLKPKEHGAYAILAIPIATGLIVGGPTVVGLLVTVASIIGFLSHEPLLVLWGHRGGRALRAAPQAKFRLWMQLGITLCTGIAALLIANTSVRIALAGCLVLAVISFAVALLGKHRTLAGQLWGVISLSAPCVPILLASGMDVEESFGIWAIRLIGLTATTVAVRGVIATQKRQSRINLWSALAIVSLAAVLGLVMRLDEMVAVLPMVAPSWYLMLKPPAPKYLKRVGWTLVGATLATGILIALRF